VIFGDEIDDKIAANTAATKRRYAEEPARNARAIAESVAAWKKQHEGMTMAEGLNRATLLGNLGEDPELKFTQSNKAYLKMRLATTESYKDGDGERKEVTHWHNIVLWGNRAEALAKILTKGARVYVEGRIETRSYDDKDGVKKYATDINATNVLLCGGGGDRAESGQRSQGSHGGGNGGGQRPQTQGRPQTSGRPQGNGNGQRPANGNAGGRPQTQRQQPPADDFAGEGGGGDFEGDDNSGMPF
jgi:single-strand DNA-binding protein